MPWGIIINCASVAVGGMAGKLFKKFIPLHICEYLSRFFGISSIVIGISLIQKASSLSPVMLALIIGAILGETICLEEKISKFPQLLSRTGFIQLPALQGNDFIQRYTSVLVLICTGSLGLVGAMTEGMTGNPSVLITKSVLDLFGAAIFASTLGYSVACIAIPQFLIYIALYMVANKIMPFITPEIIADFMCCGGVIAFVTGIRIAEIKYIRIASLLPALFLIMPVSHLWYFFFK